MSTAPPRAVQLLRSLAREVSLAFALCLGATLMALSRGSPTYWWLGWVTLVPLFLVIRLLTPVHAAVAGSFWGICFYIASGLIAGTEVPHDFTSLILLTVVPGVYAFVAAAITRRKGFHPLLLGLGWAGVELALKPLALSHGLLAGTQGNGWFLHAVGGVGGYLLVSVLLALANAWFLSVLSSVRVAWPSGRMRPVQVPRLRWLFVVEGIVRSIRFLHSVQARAPPIASSST